MLHVVLVIYAVYIVIPLTMTTMTILIIRVEDGAWTGDVFPNFGGRNFQVNTAYLAYLVDVLQHFVTLCPLKQTVTLCTPDDDNDNVILV